MERRARIGGTLGPACDDETTLRAPASRRAGRRPAELLARHLRGASPARPAPAPRGAARGPDRRAAGRPAGPAVPRRPPSRGRRWSWSKGGRSARRRQGRARPRARCRCPTPRWPATCRRGDPILLDDGKLALRVERVRGDVGALHRRARREADRSARGSTFPGPSLSVPALTPKDRRDLAAAVELGGDWLAVSFVRRAADVRLARRLLRRAGSDMPVMAKIERPEAIDRLDEILAEADGLLVARGDLGVELPTERVPILQKQIIEAANAAGKPVMTATQMLDSMREAAAPHARRGLRRGQRRARRQRLPAADRRDRGGTLSGRGGRDDGADHRGGGGVGAHARPGPARQERCRSRPASATPAAARLTTSARAIWSSSRRAARPPCRRRGSVRTSRSWPSPRRARWPAG